MAHAQCTGPKTPRDVLDLVLADHQTEVSPAHHAAAINGTLLPMDLQQKFSILALLGIDMKNQYITLDTWLTLSWHDERLAWNSTCWPDVTCGYYYYDDASFAGSPVGVIWTPSAYVANTRDTEKTMSEGYWISDSGLVYWSRRQIISLECRMDFTRLPWDEHVCMMSMSTWIETCSSMRILSGIDSNPSAVELLDGVGSIKGWKISVPHDNFAAYYVSDYYPYLDHYIVLTREPEFYVNSVMMPVYLNMSLTYLSFWIERAATPARVALVVICFLSLSNQMRSVQGELPETSEGVWLLIFLQVSMYFTFAAAVEYALAHYLLQLDRKVREISQRSQRSQSNDEIEDDDAVGPVRSHGRSRNSVTHLESTLLVGNDGRLRITGRHCDVFMRFLFPVAYGVALVYLDYNH